MAGSLESSSAIAKQIRDASRDGNIGLLKKTIDSGKELNSHVALIDMVDDCPFGGGYTPLNFAARNGREICLKYLLDQGASVNLQCTLYGDTSLIMASRNNQLECVKLLLKSRADVSIRNKKGRNASELAASDEIKRTIRNHQ